MESEPSPMKKDSTNKRPLWDEHDGAGETGRSGEQVPGQRQPGTVSGHGQGWQLNDVRSRAKLQLASVLK